MYRDAKSFVWSQPLAMWEGALGLLAAFSAEPKALGPAAAGRVKGDTRRKATGVVHISGVIEKEDMGLFGGVSTDRIIDVVRQIERDDEIGSVVFKINSPGGGVHGVQEAADAIRELGKKKPTAAVADSMAASAAYWLASAANRVYATPSSQLGSIGVFWAHEDMSKALEDCGIKTTLVAAGKYKTEGNPFEPLSDDAKAHMQSIVDGFYGSFVKSVAKGRGVTAKDVRSGFGQGRVLNASEAVSAGLADGVKSLDAVVSAVSTEAAQIGASELDSRRRLFSLTKQRISS